MKKIYFLLAIIFPALLLTSCFKDDDENYGDWEERNNAYIANAETETVNGVKKYERLEPSWAPEAFALVQWHNDRNLTARNLVPLSNSVCNVKYDVDDIEGTRISDSYSSKAYGDSIYQCKPSDNIIGFWNTLLNMHVGDSVTCILPAASAYGDVKYGSIKPNSTLIYHVKLVSIPAYERPLN